eukprot:5432562-Amphidinium_carterae.1
MKLDLLPYELSFSAALACKWLPNELLLGRLWCWPGQAAERGKHLWYCLMTRNNTGCLNITRVQALSGCSSIRQNGSKAGSDLSVSNS